MVRDRMMPAFKQGDVVRLKSGGPTMTVITDVLGGVVRLVWFDTAEDPYTRIESDQSKRTPTGIIQRKGNYDDTCEAHEVDIAIG